jgi:hypothetical protein
MRGGRRWPGGLAPLGAMMSAVTFLGACTGGDRGSGSSAWEFSADAERSGTAASNTWLRAVGQEGAEGEPRTEAVILSLDCLPEDRTSTIMTKQALRQGTAEVRLRVDAEPPQRLPAFAGTTPSGGQVVLTIPQDSVLALLRGHQRATFEYADGAGSSKTTAEFPVAGLEQYQERFLAACAG